MEWIETAIVKRFCSELLTPGFFTEQNRWTAEYVKVAFFVPFEFFVCFVVKTAHTNEG